MSDNGFGTKTNSRDYQLAVHRIAAALDGGRTRALGTTTFSDPEGHIGWEIWRDGGCAAAGDLPAGCVCPAPDRMLTGWDFGLESIQVAKDRTLWFGDEFGPCLLHADAQGRLLEAPVKLPGVTSPADPDTQAPAANFADSKGFEGMAIVPSSRTLYLMLAGVTAEDGAAGLAADRRIYEVRLGAGNRATAFTGEFIGYRMERPERSVGDLVAVNAHQFLMLERDDTQAEDAQFKKVFLVDTRDRDRDGCADNRELVDLLDAADPQRLAAADGTYRMPFVTIDLLEDLRVDHRLLPGAVETR